MSESDPDDLSVSSEGNNHRPLRRVSARTREALQDAIIQALPSITAQDALGWFRHCGYPAPEVVNKVKSEQSM